MDTTIRLLIVDDHPLFREGVKALLSTTPDIELAGEAWDGASALEQFQKIRPQVVLMDIQMPGESGIEVTRKILDDASVFAAMRAGARGYVLKGSNPLEMLGVIRAVADGQALFGPAIALRMARFFQEMSASTQGGAALPAGGSQPLESRDADLMDLSEREREVLELIAAGYNNAEIAQKLVISPKTVRNHITSIFSKLQVADRAHAIRRARGGGMG